VRERFVTFMAGGFDALYTRKSADPDKKARRPRTAAKKRAAGS
jgi:hypothetical protein